MADVPEPSSLCFCSERNSVHVHCPCEECHGKPVNYKTQERHLSALRLLQQENGKFREDLTLTSIVRITDIDHHIE